MKSQRVAYLMWWEQTTRKVRCFDPSAQLQAVRTTAKILRFDLAAQLQAVRTVTGILRFPLPAQAKRGTMNSAHFDSAFDALQARRVCSLFTMLGVIIGVGAFIAVVTLTQRVNQAINDRFGMLGANVLTIVPGTTVLQGATSAVGSAPTLSLVDAEALSQVPSIVNVSPITTLSEQVV